MIDDTGGIVWAVVADVYKDIEISDKVFHFIGRYKHQQQFPISRIIKAQNWCNKMYSRI